VSWILTIAIAICLVILCGGAVNWMNLYMAKRPRASAPEDALDELRQRLNEMDGRLRDVLDVMIALSEKFDRWEQRAEEPHTASRPGA